MDVLYITHTVFMAGANRSLLQLILEMRAKYGVTPTVLMPHIQRNYEKWNLYKECQKHNIECFSYKYFWFRENVRIISYLRCLSNILWYPRVYYKLRNRHFDLVHSNGSVISLGAFVSRMINAPHVWHLREFGLLDFNLRPLFGKGYEKFVFRYGDAFVAISNAVKNYYLPLIPEGKIRMIYNGIVPPKDVVQIRCHNDIVQFCMVGLVTEGKNQLEALEAVDILVNKWRYINFHLSFVGFEEHVYTRKLQEFVEANSLNSYVSFLGETNDVNAILSKMDVGLMLSKNEAFGRVTVEYMMQGLAVIATNSGANTEIVEDGVTGFIYHLGNVQELSSKMKSLIENKEKLSLFSGNGMKRAMDLFTSTRNTNQIYEVYKSLLTTN